MEQSLKGLAQEVADFINKETKKDSKLTAQAVLGWLGSDHNVSELQMHFQDLKGGVWEASVAYEEIVDFLEEE